jgi:anti-sigma factor RsiW
MTMDREEALLFVNAYADDELDVKEAIEVQSWIFRDAGVRAEYERILVLKRALREKLNEPAPKAPEILKNRILRSLCRGKMRSSVWLRTVTAAAAVVALSVLRWGLYQRTVSLPLPMLAEAMAAYKVEIKKPLESRSNNVQEVSSWLGKVFRYEVKPVTFSKDMGEVVGVRLCRFGGQSGTAVRMKGQKFCAAEQDGFMLAFWQKGMWFYSLMLEGDIGVDGLKKILGSSSISY